MTPALAWSAGDEVIADHNVPGCRGQLPFLPQNRLCGPMASAMLIWRSPDRLPTGNYELMALSLTLAIGTGFMSGVGLASALIALTAAPTSWLRGRPGSGDPSARASWLVSPIIAGPGEASARPLADTLPQRGHRRAGAWRAWQPGDSGAGGLDHAALPPRQSGPAAARLRIGLLGSLTINGQAGELVPAQSQLIVALALHGAGLSNGQLRRLLGADPAHPKPADSLRQLIARTRRALGRAPDGREWIEHRGHGVYALHPEARVDCVELETLAAAGARSADPVPLAEALNLVRGQPFTGCYYWWLEPSTVEAVTAHIVGASESLAQLRLRAGDPAAAVRAARVGLTADPSAEQLWRIMMRAEHAAGNLAGVRGAWGRCLDVASEVAADGQPDSATEAVYSELLAR